MADKDDYDKNATNPSAGAPLQTTQLVGVERAGAAALPDAMVHRDDHSKLEKAD